MAEDFSIPLRQMAIGYTLAAVGEPESEVEVPRDKKQREEWAEEWTRNLLPRLTEIHSLANMKLLSVITAQLFEE